MARPALALAATAALAAATAAPPVWAAKPQAESQGASACPYSVANLAVPVTERRYFCLSRQRIRAGGVGPRFPAALGPAPPAPGSGPLREPGAALGRAPSAPGLGTGPSRDPEAALEYPPLRAFGRPAATGPVGYTPGSLDSPTNGTAVPGAGTPTRPRGGSPQVGDRLGAQGGGTPAGWDAGSAQEGSGRRKQGAEAPARPRGGSPQVGDRLGAQGGGTPAGWDAGSAQEGSGRRKQGAEAPARLRGGSLLLSRAGDSLLGLAEGLAAKRPASARKGAPSSPGAAIPAAASSPDAPAPLDSTGHSALAASAGQVAAAIWVLSGHCFPSRVRPAGEMLASCRLLLPAEIPRGAAQGLEALWDLLRQGAPDWERICALARRLEPAWPRPESRAPACRVAQGA